MKFIKECLELDKNEKYVKCLNILFDKIINLIKEKQFHKIDLLIKEFINHDFSVKTYIGFLTITKAIKDNLKFRNLLYESSFIAASNDGYSIEKAEALFKGFK